MIFAINLNSCYAQPVIPFRYYNISLLFHLNIKVTRSMSTGSINFLSDMYSLISSQSRKSCLFRSMFERGPSTHSRQYNVRFYEGL